jgi:hypothetical protein
MLAIVPTVAVAVALTVPVELTASGLGAVTTTEVGALPPVMLTGKSAEVVVAPTLSVAIALSV